MNITGLVSNATNGTNGTTLSTTAGATLTNIVRPTPNQTRLIIFQVLNYIIDILIIAGNSFVIWLVVRRKSLHTVTNMLLISLAISDLLVGLTVIPSFMACLHTRCDFLLAKIVYDYFLFVSVANLCAITIDRYTAVMHPLRYQTMMSFKRVAKIIIISWLVPLMLSIPPLIWMYSDTSREDQLIANKVFYTLQVGFFVFTPCCLMMWAYARIFRESLKQARRIHSEVAHGSTTAAAQTRSVLSLEARNAYKVFGTVVAIFVLCWSLSAYRTFVIYFNLGEIDPWLTMVSRILLIFNSALNPLFYTLWKRDVRREVGRLCVGRRRNAIHPATSGSNPSAVISQQAATIGT